jgi:hypothetical protein
VNGDQREATLAPSPDFRYVGLSPGAALGPRVAASLFLAGGGVGAGLMREIGLAEAALAACLAATGVALLWRRARAPFRVSTSATPFALVPWGVLVDDEQEPRTLRWAAVRSLHVHTLYGRDGATTSTLHSLVTLETDHERFAGRTAGAVPLDRLLVHMESYAREQERRLALDLEGEVVGPGLLEPQFDRLLSAALDVIHTAPSSQRLGLEGSYRMTGMRAGEHTSDSLRAILRDRARHQLDRRPLAAILAAELRLTELVQDLIPLVQSPHPIVAGVAKVAALRLGASHARIGHIDEIAPFLSPDDVESLTAFAASRSVARVTRAEVELRA